MQKADDSVSRASARRRRLLGYLFGFLVLVPLGLAVNAGPYRDYIEARDRYEAKADEVALLERENAAYRSEMDRLGSDTYLESLARKELTYARPGEEVFIVKNLPEDEAPRESAAKPSEEGPLERLVGGIRDAF